MEFTKITYGVENRIATITLNSPKNLNAFDGTMIAEIVAALKMCEEDDEVRCVVLAAKGMAFSSGGDLMAMYMGLKTGHFERFAIEIANMADVSIAIKKLPKPVICAARGAVAGAGFNVALACDYVIADKSAMFMQAFVNVALIPDAGGFYLMTRAMGANKAMELAMTGRTVKAEEAKQLGFVAKVCESEDFEAEVAKQAARFARGPRTSYAQMKKLVWESEFKDFEAYVKKEVEAQNICGESPDFEIGVSAFIEQEKPVYT